MLATLMVATAFLGMATVSFAAEVIDKWDGTVAKSFAGGTGTQNDPYLISTGAQVALLREIVNASDSSYDSSYSTYGDRTTGAIVSGTSVTHKRLSGKYFKLINDIDMNNVNMERGIGYSNDKDYTFAFAGNFNGDGHVIKNYNLNPSKILNASGLFGITEDATIENLGIENAQVSVNQNSTLCGYGVLIGKAYGTLNLNNCYVRNSAVTLNAEYKDANEQMGVGILTGSIGDAVAGGANEQYKINNCYSVNNEIKYTYSTTEAKFRRVSVFGKTEGYGIKVNNCYAVHTDANSGLKLTGIAVQKFFSRTNNLFSCATNGTDLGYTSTGANCFVVGTKQGSAVDYLKQGTTFTITDAASLKALPAELNSQAAYKRNTYNINVGYPILNWEYERLCNPYMVDELKYQANGSDVNAPEAGATLKTANITKTIEIESEDTTAIFTYFDSNNCLQSIKTVSLKDVVFDADGTATLNIDMELPEEAVKFNGGKVKIFIWELGTLIPVNRDVIIPQ